MIYVEAKPSMAWLKNQCQTIIECKKKSENSQNHSHTKTKSFLWQKQVQVKINKPKMARFSKFKLLFAIKNYNLMVVNYLKKYQNVYLEVVF